MWLVPQWTRGLQVIGVRPGAGRRRTAPIASARPEHAADRERGTVWLGVVAVAEHDHGQALLRPAHDHVAETDRLARMPQRAAGDAPTEAVAGLMRLTGDLRMRRECERARGVVEQAVVVERRVPLREIVDRGVDAAVAEHGAGRALVGALPA